MFPLAVTSEFAFTVVMGFVRKRVRRRQSGQLQLYLVIVALRWALTRFPLVVLVQQSFIYCDIVSIRCWIVSSCVNICTLMHSSQLVKVAEFSRTSGTYTNAL